MFVRNNIFVDVRYEHLQATVIRTD